MAWNILQNSNVEMDPYVIDMIIVSGLTPDNPETVVPASGTITTSLGNLRLLNPFDMRVIVTTPPTSRCDVNWSYEGQNSITGALTFRFWGGDLTNMVVAIAVVQKGFKAGGISAM